MSGIFSTLNIANKGLQASQTSLHTTSHNISNANTEGYSRQRVDLKADLAYTLGGVGQIGTGVKIAGVSRVVDEYVTNQIRGENGTFKKYSTKSEVMAQLEIIYNEPSDTGLNFNLGEMFDAWTELSKNPELLTAKSIVVEKSKTMADTLNHIANQMESLKGETGNQIGRNVTDFNSLVGQLDTLNKQIFNIYVKGDVPNDLLDQRDLLLKDLSNISDFSVDYNDKYGRVSISVDAGEPATRTEILSSDGKTKRTLEANFDGNVLIKNSDGSDLGNLVSSKGNISGYQDALTMINKQIGEIDNFARTMAKAINTAHKDGVGTPGTDFFLAGGTDPNMDNITASNIKVNLAIQADNSKVNAGTGSSPADGDGTRAGAIANVRNMKMDFTGDNKGDNTIEGAYNNLITNVGISKQQADNMVANQEVLMDQLVLRRESTSGVSIDEEVTNILKFQTAFEANARVINALSEMLDVLINRTGA